MSGGLIVFAALGFSLTIHCLFLWIIILTFVISTNIKVYKYYCITYYWSHRWMVRGNYL